MRVRVGVTGLTPVELDVVRIRRPSPGVAPCASDCLSSASHATHSAIPSPVRAESLMARGRGMTRARFSSISREVDAEHAGEVGLGDEDQVRRLEHHGVLERLVLALGDREDDDVGPLPEVVDGRADQVADVLDEEDVRAVEVEAVERPVEQLRVEVARLPVVMALDGIPAASSRRASLSVARSAETAASLQPRPRPPATSPRAPPSCRRPGSPSGSATGSPARGSARGCGARSDRCRPGSSRGAPPGHQSPRRRRHAAGRAHLSPPPSRYR